MLFLSATDNVHASSYTRNKKLASDGKSEIFEFFVKSIPEQKSVPDENKKLPDYSDLIAKFGLESSRNPIENAAYLWDVIDLPKSNQFAELSNDEILKRVSEGLTDKEILNLAAARSNRIKKALEDWHAALNIYPQTVYLSDLLRAFQPIMQNLSLGIGVEYQKDMIQMYSQSPGMLTLRGRVVDADVRIALLDYLKEVRDVIADTRSLLAEIQKEEEMISINRESASLLSILRDVALVQYESGTRSFSDIVRLETELAARQDEVNRMTSMQQSSISNLLSMLDLPTTAEFGKITWTMDESPQLDIDEIRGNLPKTRQELQKLALEVEKMDAMLKMSRIEAAPDKTLGFSFFQGIDAQSLDTVKIMEMPPEIESSPKTEMNADSKNGMSSETQSSSMSDMSSDEQMNMTDEHFMSQPMIAYQSSNYPLDSAWAMELVDRKNAMIQMLAMDTNMDTGMLEMLYKNYSQMVRSEKVYRDNIVPKAKAALDVVRRGYSANENDFNDLISAELEYLMARMELATTRFERQKAFIETERLIGRSIKSKEKIKTVIIPSGEEK
jgi:hypothetical protein